MQAAHYCCFCLMFHFWFCTLHFPVPIVLASSGLLSLPFCRLDACVQSFRQLFLGAVSRPAFVLVSDNHLFGRSNSLWPFEQLFKFVLRSVTELSIICSCLGTALRCFLKILARGCAVGRIFNWRTIVRGKSAGRRDLRCLL